MKQHQTSTAKRRLQSDTANISENAPSSSGSAPEPASARRDDDDRFVLIATEAYFLAERRNFAPGNELDDWLAAERAVGNRLRERDAKGPI